MDNANNFILLASLQWLENGKLVLTEQNYFFPILKI